MISWTPLLPHFPHSFPSTIHPIPLPLVDASMLVQFHNLTSFAARHGFLTKSGVKGMTIHDLGDSNLDFVDLLPGDYFGRFICMGYNFGAVIDFWPTIIILQYTWPEEHPYSAVSRNTITRREMLGGDAKLLIDLSSGRIVIYGNSHAIQYILDPSSPE
jgi:hypothetical protein